MTGFRLPERYGLIASIEKDALDHMLVKIKAGNDLIADVVAQMRESEKPKVVQLEKNKKVYVLCEGAGMVLQTPMLDNCNISSAKEVSCLLDEDFVALEKNIIVERAKKLLDAAKIGSRRGGACQMPRRCCSTLKVVLREQDAAQVRRRSLRRYAAAKLEQP